jgi:hypothetical protein
MYLNDDKVVDQALDTFEMESHVFPGFGSSPAPATISFDDVEFKSNVAPAH